MSRLSNRERQVLHDRIIQRRRERENTGKIDGGKLGMGIIISVVVIIVVMCPGMASLSILKDYAHLTLDKGQSWLFAILWSIGYFLLCLLIFRNLKRALITYAVLCGVVLIVYLIAGIGLKMDFPSLHLNNFITFGATPSAS